MPGHPNIVDIRDCIKNEVGDRPGGTHLNKDPK